MSTSTPSAHSPSVAGAVPVWLPTDDGFAAAVWFLPPASVTEHRVGVLVVPGIAMEDRTLSVGITPLAESLANAGVPALVLSLSGCGNSSHDLQDSGLTDIWIQQVRRGVEHLREHGVERVVVLGIRLGGLVALDALEAADPVEAMVLWAPVHSGRRLGREMKLLAETSADSSGIANDAGDEPAETIVVGTFIVSRALLTELGRLPRRPIAVRPELPVLVVDDPERSSEATLTALRDAGAHIETRLGPETSRWLYAVSDEAFVPGADIAAVTEWVVARAAGLPALPMPVPPSAPAWRTHVFEHAGALLCETFVSFDGGRLTGTYVTPAGPDASTPTSSAWVIITSPQPGHSFVEFSRDEAAAGRANLRVDFAGHGLSPRRAGRGWGELYGPTAAEELHVAINWLGQQGHRAITALGYCAAAWACVAAAPAPRLAGVIAINPVLFVSGPTWCTDDGQHGSRFWRFVDAHDSGNVMRRLRLRYRRDVALSSPALRGMRRLLADGTRVLLQFDTEEGGLTFYRRFEGSRFSTARARGDIAVHVYEGLSHGLGDLRGRNQVLVDARAFVADGADRAGGASDGGSASDG